MTCADPFTRACPLYGRAQALAGRTGPAFEWTGAGNWFGLPRLLARAGRNANDRNDHD